MFKVYWSNKEGDTYGKSFFEMTEALQHTQDLRNQGFMYVCLASEIVGSITKMGVDSVKNGQLPNGQDYDWRKRR